MEVFKDLPSNKDITNEKKTPISTTTGQVILGITGGIALGLTLVSSSFVRPAFRKYCLPYIPATDEQIKNVLTALKNRRGLLLDLGSGDGRIVIETAKIGFTSHGVELNPWLVLYSKYDAWRKGLGKNTGFYRRDLWKYDVSKYNNIVIFGVEQMMENLEKKLIKECQNGSYIIACRFPLPIRKPIATIGCGVDTVWVYTIENNKPS
ncbi:ATP synthase subunit C lysine N-methyltransferase [Coccinella septempunctata]|uniref:ATP synthase subunit C lysine N-methyltransferase n=1 Tax=Coccinella septempunctata TaxID=41139 RepID=UPI001D061343|nr:ATP synthase subunit C lysine N-methyltransferase [Coccinella septempunctata]